MTCSGEQRVTTMVLRVLDLDCHQCFKRVKKLLCQFPQIRNQVFDERNNMVVITVVCCSPEKIRDKLCRKGCRFIKSIEIRPPPPIIRPAPLGPTPAPDPAQPTKPTPTPEPDEKPKPLPPAPEQKPAKPSPPPKQQEPVAQWVPGFLPCPPPHMIPVAVCYVPWPGGPWPGGPWPCHGNCFCRCDFCWCNNNPSLCSIM